MKITLYIVRNPTYSYIKKLFSLEQNMYLYKGHNHLISLSINLKKVKSDYSVLYFSKQLYNETSMLIQSVQANGSFKK